MEGSQQAIVPLNQPNAESFEDLLAHTFCDLPDAVKQEPLQQCALNKDSAAISSSRSDVEQKRDAVSGAINQHGQQASHPSSGTCSEHGASSGVNEPEHSGRGRGRGRKSTRAAGQQETAQQRAHRRFYERKKAKMAALEQEFADKQAEYQRLLRQNAELKRKHDALEWTIAGRDEQMSLLQALSSLSLGPPGSSRPQQTVQQAAGTQDVSRRPLLQTQLHPSLPGSSRASIQGVGAAEAVWQTPAYGSKTTVPAPQPYRPSEQHEIARQYEAAGPFGMIQVLSDRDRLTMPPPAPAAAFKAPQPQPQRTVQDTTVVQQQWPWQPQQLRTDSSALNLQRSISMPAQAPRADAAAGPALPVLPGHPVPAAAASSASQMHRSQSSSPHVLHGVEHASSRPPVVTSVKEYTYADRQVFAQHRASAPGSSSHSHTPVGHTGWTVAPSRLQQVSTQQPMPPPLQGHVVRPSSWSSPSSPSSDVPAAPAVAVQAPYQQQPAALYSGEPYADLQQQQERQYSRSSSMPGMSTGGRGTATHESVVGLESGVTARAGWMPSSIDSRGIAGGVDVRPSGRGTFHTITTAGPLPAAQLQVQRTGSDPTANFSRWHVPVAQQHQPTIWQDQQPQWQQQQQQDWEQDQQQGTRRVSCDAIAGQQGASFLHPPLQAPGTQQQTLLPQQQLQQQLEQIYNMPPMPPTEDELMMIDDDLMLLLEQSLTQQDFLDMQMSVGPPLSPLPSIPSSSGTAAAEALAAAGLTDAVVANLGEQHLLAEAPEGDHTSPAAVHAPVAAAAAAAAAVGHVSRRDTSGSSGASGRVSRRDTSGSSGSGYRYVPRKDTGGSTSSAMRFVDLLHTSEQLQAKHKAAGFFPPTSGPDDFFYLHHFVEWYRAKIEQMSALMPLVDCPVPDVSAGYMLVQIVEETIMGIRKFSTRNRVGIWELKLINLETGEMAEAPIIHWKSVLAQLGMSSAQREQPIACYNLLQEYMEKCKQERVAILQHFNELEIRLTGSCGAPGVRSSDPGQGPGAGLGIAAGLGVPCPPAGISMDPAAAAEAAAVRQSYVRPNTLQFRQNGLDEYQGLLEKLQVSVLREHMIANMLMYSIVQVVSHAQMAKAMVASYPFWPNGSAIMLLMQEEEAAVAARQEKLPKTWLDGVSGRPGSA